MPCTPCDERCSVQCTYCNVEVLYVVTTAIRLACSISNNDTSAVVSARAHGFCSVHVPYSYGFFLQVDALRTVSTRQNKECLTERIDNGTPAVLRARAHLLDVICGDYCDRQFFLQADSLQTLLPSIGKTWIIT